MGVWGRSPQRGPGAEPLVRGSGGLLPPEAGDNLCFNVYDFSLNLLHEKRNQIAISSH
jgi:hypothetical protein